MTNNIVKQNFVFDTILFLIMTTITGTSLLLKFVLIPGRESKIIYGNNTELFYLGLNRHQWGDIHFFLGVTLWCMLIIHLFWHWPMIRGMFLNAFPIKSPPIKKAILILFVILNIFLLSFAFIGSPEIRAKTPLKRFSQ